MKNLKSRSKTAKNCQKAVFNACRNVYGGEKIGKSCFS
jgi:hypothetical protein